MANIETLIKDLGPRPFSIRGKLWTTLLIAVIAAGIIAYIDQLIKGQQVTNMRDYALWGIYISNFVFFVATSFVGAVTVAILRLTHNSWRTPFVRIAEIISLASIIMAGITIIIDMARPDRVLNLFVHARLQSPITWDVIIIPTFIVFSILLLYFPLIPDLALLKKYYEQSKPMLSRFYGRLALNWSGSEVQKQLQSRAVQIICIMIIPVALILQTIDAWLFSTTYRVGWDSSNFAPYFISGAFVAGVGALVAVISVVRWAKKLENYITEFHYDKIGRFLALACMIYIFFNINEYLIPAFTSKKAESVHLETLFSGDYATPFWLVTIVGLVIPAILLMFRAGRKPKAMFVISILLVLGSWWKRYIIVTPTLLHPFLPIQGVPESWRSYFPSLHEWLITGATLAMALLIITLLIRYFPVIPVQRTADEQNMEAEINPTKA